jgi:hypothetical protein
MFNGILKVSTRLTDDVTFGCNALDALYTDDWIVTSTDIILLRFASLTDCSKQLEFFLNHLESINRILHWTAFQNRCNNIV